MTEFVPKKTLVPIPTIAQPSTTGAKINGFFFCGGQIFAKFLPENYNFYICEGFFMGKMAPNSPDFKIFSPICQIFVISSSIR